MVPLHHTPGIPGYRGCSLVVSQVYSVVNATFSRTQNSILKMPT